jgi:DNA topoisomerase-1
MTLYVEDRDDSNDEDDESIIPELNEGETLKKERIDSKQSFTEPPARYTEASLVKELEQKGIGRPSTYATIISTIMDRKYVGKEKKQLVPTDLGKVVNTLLVENFPDIINVEFTADIENQFDSIAEGKEPWKQVIREFYGPFEKELKKVEEEVEHVKLEEQVSNVKCEKCGKLMVVKEGRFGKFLACPGFPDCKNIKPFVTAIDVPCPVCGSEVYERRARRGKCYYICSKNNQKLDNPCIYISWEKPVEGQEWDPTEALENLEKKKKRAAKKEAGKTTKKKTTAKKTTTKKTTKKATTKKTTTKKAATKKAETSEKKTTKKATTKKATAKKTTAKKTTTKRTTKKSSK